MFATHFTEQTKYLEDDLKKCFRKYKAPSPEKKKDLRIFSGFYNFISEHLPDAYTVVGGKPIRNKKQLLKNHCDAIIYRPWCKSYLKMTQDYVLTPDIYSFFSIEVELASNVFNNHLGLTRALKSLYLGHQTEHENEVVPLYSILFIYKSQHSLLYAKRTLINSLEKKDIPINQQVDIVCILGKGLIIKDWENGGVYKAIETEGDTLMWFYILLIEYLDRDGNLQMPLREYIKENKNYKEC